jgi:putative acetyltransferase
MVAEIDGEVVGHVLCSRGRVEPDHSPALGLGPLGVLPDHQQQGVGQALMHAVLGAVEALGEPLVALLGEPGYYSRFGFVPSTQRGIESPDANWGRYFQIRTFDNGRPPLKGTFRYAPPFDDL